MLPEDDAITQRVWLEAKQCELFDGLLYRHAWPQWGSAETRTLARLAIPASRTEVIMHAHHDDLLAGHLGRNWTVARVNSVNRGRRLNTVRTGLSNLSLQQAACSRGWA